MSRTRRGPIPISDAIQAFLRDSGLGARSLDVRVFRAWSRALGPKLADRAVAVAFRDGELVVEVESAALLQELRNFTGTSYRRKANEELGSERIRRIRFKLRG